jgi:hypothetical protein
VKVKERLAVNKQRSHGFHMERIYLKKLNGIESREIYRVFSDSFAGFED